MDMETKLRKENDMKQVICPLDGKPCENDCPDRYKDQPEGGCFLTTAQELGANIIDFCGGNIRLISGGCAFDQG